MEIFGVLIGLGIVVFYFVAPVVALIRARSVTA